MGECCVSPPLHAPLHAHTRAVCVCERGWRDPTRAGGGSARVPPNTEEKRKNGSEAVPGPTSENTTLVVFFFPHAAVCISFHTTPMLLTSKTSVVAAPVSGRTAAPRAVAGARGAWARNSESRWPVWGALWGRPSLTPLFPSPIHTFDSLNCPHPGRRAPAAPHCARCAPRGRRCARVCRRPPPARHDRWPTRRGQGDAVCQDCGQGESGKCGVVGRGRGRGG